MGSAFFFLSFFLSPSSSSFFFGVLVEESEVVGVVWFSLLLGLGMGWVLEERGNIVGGYGQFMCIGVRSDMSFGGDVATMARFE